MHSFNYYEFLGLNPNATAEEIKKAFRKKSFDCHPDHGGSNEQMRKLLLVYDVLSNPSKRESYDASNTYFKHKYSEEKKRHKEEKTTEEEQHVEDDYSKAVFVDGIEAEDCSGSVSYHKKNSFIYYPLQVKKKFLLWEYESFEYYRAQIKMIFSRKRNNFYNIPLFVVEIEGFEQIVFLKDYKQIWFSQVGFDVLERKKAMKTLIAWTVATIIIILLLFNPQIMQPVGNTTTESYDDTAEYITVDSDCNIKGNISIATGSKIYHLPEDEYYEETIIDTNYGERWFCTEGQAEAAGWRRAYE